jgi:hypothetical protein
VQSRASRYITSNPTNTLAYWANPFSLVDVSCAEASRMRENKRIPAQTLDFDGV